MRNSSPVERLTAADASNVMIDAEDQVNVFLMAGLLGRGGFVGADGSADLARLRAFIATRLDDDPGLQRFNQRVGTSGRRLVWEPSRPDLTWHVRQAEPVSGSEGLAGLCAALMTTMMPSDRPGWELLVVPGASPEGTGIVLRVHHAIADGVATVALVRRLFDSPDRPAAEPSATRRPAAVRQPPWRRLALSVSRLTAMFRTTVPATALLGPISRHHGVAFVEVDLARLAHGAKTAGGTVNDALLAAVNAATMAALRGLGEPLPPTLPASVPVALPDRGNSGNAVGVMLVPLPIDDLEPSNRVARIAKLTMAAKDEARSQGSYELTRTRWGSRLLAHLARRQRFVALFVSSVRGPAEPLLLAGAPLAHAWPVTQIQGNVRLGVSGFSYAGRLSCTVHVDAEALDVAQLGRSLSEELTRIADLA